MPGKKHAASNTPRSGEAVGGGVKRIELVVKCDSVGVVDAVVASIVDIKVDGIKFEVIDSGVGPISKSDLMMALSGSKLVVGFDAELMPKLEQFVREHGLEVRIYRVIYRLIEDLRMIARSLLPQESGEETIGSARVIALFKSGHKDSILGCEITAGSLTVGKDFRVISAMGPIYNGKIESMQIERRPAKQAGAGQQVGIKIRGFNKAKIGDLVESYRAVVPEKSQVWSPKGDIIYVDG